MPDPMHDENDGMYREGKGTTPMTTADSDERSLRIKPFYEFRWAAKVILRNIIVPILCIEGSRNKKGENIM